MKKILSFWSLLLFAALSAQQYISVSAKTPDQLVRDVLIGSQSASCISVSNVSATGWQDFGSSTTSYGYFEKGTLPFDIDKGIILSTGDLFKVPGPNSSRPTINVLDDTDTNWPGDPDLADALGVDVSYYLNSSVLEFDFTPSNTTGISFEYMFLSEEYYDTNCDYPDAFVFLIKKAGTSDPYKNIALIPGTTQPVTSQTINAAQGCQSNVQYFGTFNNDPYRSHLDSPTAFNGETKVLTAAADVVPGETYHIKLVVADRLFGGDRTGRFDSAVFLKAGSFTGKKDLGPDLLFADNTALCEGTDITLDATTASAVSYQWYKDGSLLAGENAATITIVGDKINNGKYSVEIELSGCLLKGSRTVEFAEIPLTISKSYCNYKNGEPIAVSLQQLNSEYITNYQPYFQVQYFQDAAHQVALPNQWSYTQDTVVYYTIKSGTCTEVIGSIQFLTPKKSAILSDKTVCPGATTTLDAGSGFKYYKWLRKDGSTIAEGATVSSINSVGAGEYSVELTSPNGCKLIQQVTVSESSLPVISHVDVAGSQITIHVSGGVQPFLYSIDGVNFQASNIFTNVPRGPHTAYVKDALNCGFGQKPFLILNLINVITPNGDGINDVLDYSDLKIKENVSIMIFSRNGTRVFQSANDNYLWDGKLDGRALPTGTYWYVLTWTEPVSTTSATFTGWVLLKNRN